MDARDRQRIIDAIDYWIKVKLDQQALSEAAGTAQGGSRAAVTGGKHLAGINRLLLDELDRLGLDNLTYYTDRAATLAGYFRASKSWDLLVLADDVPVLAVEYKSMTGSEGKNLNNRADEVIGVAEDLRRAQAASLVPSTLQRAYVFLMEMTPAVQKPVGVTVKAGTPDPAFENATYLDRMAIMCDRLRASGLYDMTWAVGVRRDPTDFVEPLETVGWTTFSAALAKIFTDHGQVP